MVNQTMISMHIVAYLAIIIADFLFALIPLKDLTVFETSMIFLIVVYSVCNVIFGIIVY